MVSGEWRVMSGEVRRHRSWRKKFRDAFRGVGVGMRGERSFGVHFLFAVGVIVGAVVMRVDRIEWCVLLLSIAVVLTAEMFNSAVERMAKAITEEHDPRLADALDVGSAAVLVAAIGAGRRWDHLRQSARGPGWLVGIVGRWNCVP